MTLEEQVRHLREEQFRLLDRVDILWRLVRKTVPDDQYDELDEYFRYHCGMEAHANRQWIEEHLPGLTEEDQQLVMRERMVPRLSTPREELLERLARVIFDGAVIATDADLNQITSLRKAAGL